MKDKSYNHYSPVPIGHEIIISHRDFCPYWKGKTIHIWRDDMANNSCKFVSEGRDGGNSDLHLIINYKDGESLFNANVTIDEIASFARISESLLIHCTVGQTRSPTIALIAKIARGASPYQALGDIMKANWDMRGIVSNFCLTPVKEILEWADHYTVIIH